MPKRYKSKKHKNRKNFKSTKKTYDEDISPDEFPPRSFIISQGDVGSSLKELVMDFKKVMKPNTAEKLKSQKNNKLSDFVSMAGPLKVTHLIIFNFTTYGANIKISRLPQGPTLTFRIQQYTLSSEVLSTAKSQMTYATQFLTAPCLMTNIQPDDGDNHLRLCAQMILDLYPNINPSSVNINDIKRCCLFNYDIEKEEFEFRHYSIRTRPVGLSKAVRKLVESKVPDLHGFTDISDYILKSEAMSDTEGEEDSKLQIDLSLNDRKKKTKRANSSIKLSELGPRLTLQLIKIEEGLCTGTVLYHRFHEKDPEEVLEYQKKKEEQQKLKEKRRKEQMANVQRKNEEKERHKKKCLDGMRQKTGLRQEDSHDQDRDDAQYYREEVGQEPDKDLFLKKTKRKREKSTSRKNFKRRK